MSRISGTYRQTCVIPPGVFVGPGSPPGGDNLNGGGTGAPPSGGSGATAACGPLNPSDPSDPTSADCSDPVFAAANPSICGNPIYLVETPSVSNIAVAATLQYSCYITQGGNNITVNQGLVFTSSNTAIATVNATTGLATGVTVGTVTISADWHGYTTSAQLTVNPVGSGSGPTGTYCSGVTADIVLVIDNSNSMSQVVSTSLSSPPAQHPKFYTAIQSAMVVIGAMSTTQARVGIVTFNGAPVGTTTSTAPSDTIVSPLTNNESTLFAALQAIPQSSNQTQIYPALKDAYNMLAVSTATHKVVILLSDGDAQDKDEPLTVCAPQSGGSPLAVVRAIQALNGGLFVSGGVYATGDGFLFLQCAASAGYFYNVTDIAISGVAGCGESCLPIIMAQLPSQLCVGYTWGYAQLAPAPVAASTMPDIETGGTTTSGSSYTYTASYTAQCSSTSVGDSVTMSATYTSTISMADAQYHAQQQAQAAATSALSCCTNAVNILQDQLSVPYPACYEVSGFTGTVTGIEVTLDDFNTSATGDKFAVLVSPLNKALVLLSGNGGVSGSLGNQMVTFAAGGATLPPTDFQSGTVVDTGTWTPAGGTILNAGCITGLPATLTFVSNLAAFNGDDPNGIWNLYFCSDQGLNAGYIGSWFVTVNGVNSCACDSAPATMHVHGGAGGSLSGVACSTAATSVQTAWDGTAITQVTGQCSWSTGVLTTTKSLNGKKLYSLEVNLVQTGGACYFELYIRTTDSSGNPITTWRGWKAGAFDSGPTGVYNYAPVYNSYGYITNQLCSSGPATLQLDAN